MKSLAKILAVATGIVALVGNANAVPTLYLSDGAVSVTVADGGPMDSNPLPGVVTYNGAIGANWTMNVTTGTTKPTLGSATQPWMQLSSINASSKGTGQLTIMFSEDNFGPVAGVLNTQFGGTTAGTVSANTYADAGNGIFSSTTPLTSMGPFAGTLFGASQSCALDLNGPFSLTEVATIVHTHSGVTSLSELVRVPDAGFTLALLGSSFLGLAFLARSRKTA